MADFKNLAATEVIAELVSGNLVCLTFHGRDKLRSGLTWWEISYAPTTVDDIRNRWFWCFTITPKDDEFVLERLHLIWYMGGERTEHAFNTLDEAIAAAVSMFVLEDREQAFMEIPF
jgi:hypothetical protein